MNAYIFISFSLFFVIHFWFTQKIYSHNHFIIALLFSLVIPFTAFLLINRDDWIKSLPLGLLVFIFVVLLFLVKRSYRQINKLLIRKNLIRKDYDEKDFTYVLWDSDVNIPNWWDEKLASKPSWLDNFISFMLLILPILLMIVLKKLIDNFS